MQAQRPRPSRQYRRQTLGLAWLSPLRRSTQVTRRNLTCVKMAQTMSAGPTIPHVLHLVLLKCTHVHPVVHADYAGSARSDARGALRSPKRSSSICCVQVHLGNALILCIVEIERSSCSEAFELELLSTILGVRNARQLLMLLRCRLA